MSETHWHRTASGRRMFGRSLAPRAARAFRVAQVPQGLHLTPVAAFIGALAPAPRYNTNQHCKARHGVYETSEPAAPHGQSGGENFFTGPRAIWNETADYGASKALRKSSSSRTEEFDAESVE